MSNGSIDWKRKLSSRKFIISVLVFIFMIVSYATSDPGTAQRVISMILLVVDAGFYVISEGISDMAGAQSSGIDPSEVTEQVQKYEEQAKNIVDSLSSIQDAFNSLSNKDGKKESPDDSPL